MAGMRIGYAMGNEQLIKYLSDVKYSFNSYTMNATAIALGTAAMRDRAYFEETKAKIIATRERAKERLAALGFSFVDSRANFIFAAHKSVPAEELFLALKQAGIYVRYFKSRGLTIISGSRSERMRRWRSCINSWSIIWHTDRSATVKTCRK